MVERLEYAILASMFESGFTPSVAEPSHEERSYAIGTFEAALRQKSSTTIDDLPSDVKDILIRDDIVMHERAVFQRDDTAIIPERMLNPDKPLEFTDILAMLHVYFWWNGERNTPTDYLEKMLEDFDDKRFKEAVKVLHTIFTPLCDDSEEGLPCKRDDGLKCFKRWLRNISQTELLQDRRRRAGEVLAWLEGIDEHEDDEDTPDEYKLAHYLAGYAVRALVQAGTDEVEASYVRNSLHLEEERRMNEPMEVELDDYAEYRAKHSYEEALSGYWVSQYTTPLGFARLTREYEDLPADALDWDRSLRRALAQRFIAENPEYFQLFEDSYQWEENGMAPFYIRRFAEEYWPPEQRI